MKSTKFLGITIDEHLDWKVYIDNLSNKIARNVGTLTNIRKLQLLEKKAIRIITSSHYIAHTYPLFSMTKLKLDDLYRYQLGIFMHKVTHFQLPQNMSSMFLRTEHKHKHQLRNQKCIILLHTTNKNKHQGIHNNLFWTEILEHSSCQYSTTCFHTPV